MKTVKAKARGVVMTSEKSRSLNLKSVSNARELGGYKTKDGKTIKRGLLLRTGHLLDVTEDEKAVLADKYDLYAIGDLRSEREAAAKPDAPIGTSRYYGMSVFDMLSAKDYAPGTNAASIAELDLITVYNISKAYGLLNDDLYAKILESEKGKEGYTKFFKMLSDAPAGRAVLWHCTGGKDRTGIAAALLMSVLGVDEETVVEDFMATNLYNAERIAKTRSELMAKNVDNDVIDGVIVLVDGVDERFLINAINFMKDKYGSATGYVKTALGVTDEEIKALKNKYLE